MVLTPVRMNQGQASSYTVQVLWGTKGQEAMGMVPDPWQIYGKCGWLSYLFHNPLELFVPTEASSGLQILS